MPDLSREEVQALLPWYAAGSLGAADSHRVADWLAGQGAGDSEIQAELDWLRLTVRQVKDEVQQQLPAANQGLQTLLQRVREEAAGSAASAPASAAAGAVAPPAAGPAAKASPLAPPLPSQLPSPLPSPPSPSRPSAGSPLQALWQWLRQASPARSLGLAGLALAQTAVIVVLVQRPAGEADGAGGQAPLSGSPDPRLPALADGTLLQLGFAPTATEPQIRAALQQAQAVLVAGPGSLGIYTVVVPRAAAEASVAALRQQTGVVESVQVLPAGPGR